MRCVCCELLHLSEFALNAVEFHVGCRSCRKRPRRRCLQYVYINSLPPLQNQYSVESTVDANTLIMILLENADGEQHRLQDVSAACIYVKTRLYIGGAPDKGRVNLSG